ncbi:hypothetical protein [Mycoplasma suis]
MGKARLLFNYLLSKRQKILANYKRIVLKIYLI